MNLLEQLSRGMAEHLDKASPNSWLTTKRRKLNPGGRPSNPNSRRQRLLSWLDEHGPATNREIAAGIGDDVHPVRMAMGELAREGYVVTVGKVSNRVIWSVA